VPDADFLVVDAGTAPENATGLLRRFGPEVVVLVDAAEMGDPPGAVRWLEGERALGCSASTHTLPLGLLVRFLAESLGCRVRLLGIQPARIATGSRLSAPVHRSVDRLARRLARLRRTGPTCGLASCAAPPSGDAALEAIPWPPATDHSELTADG
jgi:hydrogenase maturation protease